MRGRLFTGLGDGLRVATALASVAAATALVASVLTSSAESLDRARTPAQRNLHQATSRRPAGDWSCERGTVALTFNDGPDVYTRAFLRVLDHYDARAEFFVIGRKVGRFRPLVRRMAAEGHRISNQTWSRPVLSDLSNRQVKRELRRTQAAIVAAGAGAPAVMRPPYGQMGRRILRIVRGEGLAPQLWTVDSRDWDGRRPGLIARRVSRLAGPGAIVQLHDGAGFSHRTIKALPRILEDLRRRGLCPGFATAHRRQRLLQRRLPPRAHRSQAPR
ncbi:MAG: polysaccharide deacetylase family protein, partial [Actinomycetota bacterium]|nr:polysaccharide deacetylase family protein [Actinomycetota bacterium]